jgi:hypothetical protein
LLHHGKVHGLTAVATTVALLVASCKTSSGVTGLMADERKVPQCNPGAAFKGVCQVVEVTGRQGTTTEAARASFAGELAELRFSVPMGGRDAHATAQFFLKNGLVEELQITDAMDLYGRQGCLAEINGGVVGEGFTPRVTLHALFNVKDESRSGHAEISDYRTGKSMLATLGLMCEWQ